MNHFTRLIDLTSADEEYISAFATTLAPCVLRPKTETSLTLEEKHSYRLVRDLLAHKDHIFSELKRMSSLSHSSSTNARPRAISTDESNRKALMEERNRALLEKASANRGRATSPAPGPRGHRRDRSSGGPETRFPIQTSPTTHERPRSTLGSLGSIGAITGGVPTPNKRSSLDVPDPEPPNGLISSDHQPTSNGVGKENESNRDSVVNHRESLTNKRESLTNKRDSLTSKRDSTGVRTPTKFVGGRRVPASPPSGERGITLEDRPMED